MLLQLYMHIILGIKFSVAFIFEALQDMGHVCQIHLIFQLHTQWDLTFLSETWMQYSILPCTPDP